MNNTTNTEGAERVMAFRLAESQGEPERGPDCAECRVELIDGERDFCAACLVIVAAEDAARGLVAL